MYLCSYSKYFIIFTGHTHTQLLIHIFPTIFFLHLFFPNLSPPDPPKFQPPPPVGPVEPPLLPGRSNRIQRAVSHSFRTTLGRYRPCEVGGVKVKGGCGEGRIFWCFFFPNWGGKESKIFFEDHSEDVKKSWCFFKTNLDATPKTVRSEGVQFCFFVFFSIDLCVIVFLMWCLAQTGPVQMCGKIFIKTFEYQHVVT